MGNKNDWLTIWTKCPCLFFFHYNFRPKQSPCLTPKTIWHARRDEKEKKRKKNHIWKKIWWSSNNHGTKFIDYSWIIIIESELLNSNLKLDLNVCYWSMIITENSKFLKDYYWSCMDISRCFHVQFSIWGMAHINFRRFSFFDTVIGWLISFFALSGHKISEYSLLFRSEPGYKSSKSTRHKLYCSLFSFKTI